MALPVRRITWGLAQSNFLDTLDNILLSRIKKDDEDAFALLFRQYYVQLCRYAMLFVGEKYASEEIVMNLFTSIWENRDKLNNVKSLRPYLFRSIKNRCLNWFRDRDDNIRLDDTLLGLLTYENSSLEIDELNKFVEEAIMSLPDRCKDVFLMSKQENMKHKEIAKKMNISTKTVESQITKALRRIREYLDNMN